MNEIHDPERENPESVAAEIGVQGIEGLPSKIDRYSKAKKGSLDIADYMATLSKYPVTAAKVKTCGDYLVFRHYWTVDKVRLHGASLCKIHLLCPLCAIRRGAKALKAYLDRWEVIKAEKPAPVAKVVEPKTVEAKPVPAETTVEVTQDVQALAEPKTDANKDETEDDEDKPIRPRRPRGRPPKKATPANES